MGKDCVQISASASMLLDAIKNIEEHPSTADDTGTQVRRTIHFCQHAINKGCVEMEALQAAGVVLGVHSSGKSDAIQYYSGWDMVRLAKIASKGHAGDIDFRNEDLEGVDTYCDDVHGGGNDGLNEVSDNQRRLVRSESIVNNDADTTMDLLDKYCTTGGDKQVEGFARVYKTLGGEHIPVSEAHHYMHRDKKLWRFSAYEFGRLFTVRVMTNQDLKWYTAAIAQPPPIPTRKKSGRGCDRYLLQAPHPLHKSHILVPRVKLGIPAFTGTPPPSDTSSQIMDTTTSQKQQRYAEFFFKQFHTMVCCASTCPFLHHVGRPREYSRGNSVLAPKPRTGHYTYNIRRRRSRNYVQEAFKANSVRPSIRHRKLHQLFQNKKRGSDSPCKAPSASACPMERKQQAL